jgi:DNA repair protein RecN (Recombination protein N)
VLRELRIKNFVLIEELALTFSGGFNVLTGETGAGKSILIGAITLLLGDRTGTDLIRTGAEEAHIEGLFEPEPGADDLKDLFARLGLPFQDQVILRRLLNRNGRGKVYINNAFASLDDLRTVSLKLLEIHGQHDHHNLSDPAAQLHILDEFARAAPLRTEYALHFQNLLSYRKEKIGLEAARETALRERELIEFQLSEIELSRLTPGEEENLLKEEKRLQNREQIARLVEEVRGAFDGEEGLLEKLGKVRTSIQAFQSLTGEETQTRRLVEEAYVNLKEASREMGRRGDPGDFDPRRLEAVSERLHQIGRLKKKYGGSVEAILEKKEELAERRASFEGKEERLSALDRRVREEEKVALELSSRLTELRRAGAAALEKSVESEFASLKMEKTRFQAVLESVSLYREGAETAGFFISLPGEASKPIGRVASGGELSRIMLALKAVLSASDPVPTLIFDEIDAGIGGAVAEKVGRRLRRLARRHQVFCVTHLPQIASLADRHYSVAKREHRGRINTEVFLLDGESRVEEIARMLGGQRMTETTRRHAREMISTALRPES